MFFPFNIFIFSVLLILFKKTVQNRSSISSSKVNDDCECGKHNGIAARIVGGKTALPHEFPWMAALLYDGLPFCGGALINDRHILTAGHCIKWVSKKHLSIALGFHDKEVLQSKEREALIVDVQDVKLHENFTVHKKFDTFDIALVKLKYPVKYNEKIRPICLPTDPGEKYVGKPTIIAGWGMLGSDTKTSSRYLQKAKVVTLSDEACRKAPMVGQYILDSNICAYEKKIDSCQGDSGGPLVFETKTGKMEVIGIVSWGIGCAREGIPGIYTRTTSFLDWIAENTQDAIYCKNPA